MSLLETVVLSNIVKVVSSDNNCPLHLNFDNRTSQDATSNGNVAGEWALLVDVLALDGLPWYLEAKTHISRVPQLLLR